MSDREIMPEIRRSLCTLCGHCVVACPVGALSMTDEGVVMDEDACSYCGDCEGICPEGAIRLPYAIVLSNKEEHDGDGST
jgi:pyruvate formate lyase activating enzyme